jgi:SAM-dependent methyltransferase
MKALLHAHIPWWAKIAAKMTLARLPVPPRAWHRLGLFVPGFMRDPAYAIGVFEAHWRRAGAPAPGFTYLELGPGESLATAIVAWAFGADGGALVDAGDFAVRDVAAYRPLLDKLAEHPRVRDVRGLRSHTSLDALLAAVNARVSSDGLIGLKSLPSDSIDLVFSQAVLEHVPLAEFAATVRELYRVQRAGGFGSHRIDFRDHLQGSLNNLRFSEALWERPWFAKRSGFYTNRLRLSVVAAMFANAGFSVTITEQNRWSAPPLARASLASKFRALTDDDLRTSSAILTMTKPA